MSTNLPALAVPVRRTRVGTGAAVTVALLCLADAASAMCTGGGRFVAVLDQDKRIEAASLPPSDPFRRFVEGTMWAAGVKTGLALDPIELRFERRRFGAPEDAERASSEDQPPDFDTPWLKVRRSSGPCRLKATFIWDERQIIVDQALLWGVRAETADPKAREPAGRDAIAGWLRAYEAAAFHVSPAERERRLSELEGRMPFDILWLFRNSSQSTRGPFAGYVSDDFANLLDRTEPGYRKLAVALFERAKLETGGAVAIRDIRQTATFFDAAALRVETIR